VVHGVVIGRLVQQPCPEVGAVVVVAHGPDDLGAQVFAGRINDGPQFCVRFGIPLVRKVAGEDDGLRPGAGSTDFIE
jgi:hypothetical protein